jgi:nicotinate-nucleotide adenylyltransferase
MISAARLGVLGGTLDPVHAGHIETALAARRALGLDRTLLLPSRIPPHRPIRPSASPYHRFAMAALAIDGVEGLEVSDLELCAPGTSYTSDTLERFHAAGLTPAQIFFITGADAFAEIETWRRYPEVLDMAHFVVVSRPGQQASSLRTKLAPLAARMRTGTPEAALASKPTVFLVDWQTPDVSSTEIRRRVRAGETLAGLVAPAVEQHIRKHRLYSDEAANGDVTAAADHLHGEN